MTSLPTVFSVGSAASQNSFIASYQRAQTGFSSSGLPSDITGARYADEDEEALLEANNEYEDDDDLPTPRPNDVRRDSISDIEWDDDLVHPSRSPSKTKQPKPVGRLSSTAPEATEHTPLLRKSVSLHIETRPLRSETDDDKHVIASRPAVLSTQTHTQSTVVAHHQPVVHRGQSTFGQTLFNSIAILLGIGMLSEPLAFAYAGWICGTLLIIFYGFITCYTAKILARIVLSDPRIKSYSDVGRKAFGPKSMPFISAMFCLELFSVSVILVTLYADSLHAVLPAFSSDTYKLLGIIILIPTVFFPLSLLSYTSILGIVSTIFLVVVIFFDGFTKKDAPGSLWDPASTHFGFMGIGELGVAFGLFMAGFSGHAVIPSIARDMAEPHLFDTAMNYAFTVATLVYAVIGMAGYLMFGNDVYDEISQNLLGVAGYSPTLNKIALWMLVISPLSKFALSSRPLNITLETLLGLETGFSSDPHGHGHISADPQAHAPAPTTTSTKYTQLPTPQRQTNASLKRLLLIFERIFLVLLAVGISILVPEFSSMMAILGAFAAFILCVIGPVTAKVVLEGKGKCGLFDAFLLVVGGVMAVWGTAAACWSAAEGV